MFQVGDKVVYPNHGVGLIKQVMEIEIGGQIAQFFEVLILNSNSVVKVPAANAQAVGLRQLLTKNEIHKVYEYLRSDELIEYDDWKERFKQNSDLMRTGKIADMNAVIKCLYFVSLEKPLSFREKRMYERALQLLSAEIAEVTKTTDKRVEEKLIETMRIAAEAKGVLSKDDGGE